MQASSPAPAPCSPGENMPNAVEVLKWHFRQQVLYIAALCTSSVSHVCLQTTTAVRCYVFGSKYLCFSIVYVRYYTSTITAAVNERENRRTGA